MLSMEKISKYLKWKFFSTYIDLGDFKQVNVNLHVKMPPNK